jgi:AraC-like DNA-binding protein
MRKEKLPFLTLPNSVAYLMAPINTNLVKAHIARNLPAIHTVADVSRGLGLSRETLRKSFVRIEKISLRHYIASIRVEEMKELLQTTSLSCMAVCLELGCREDVGARLFKQHTGVTMQVFRDGQRGKLFAGSSHEIRGL